MMSDAPTLSAALTAEEAMDSSFVMSGDPARITTRILTGYWNSGNALESTCRTAQLPHAQLSNRACKSCRQSRCCYASLALGCALHSDKAKHVTVCGCQQIMSAVA